MNKNYEVISFIYKYFNLRRSEVINSANVMEIVTNLIDQNNF